MKVLITGNRGYIGSVMTPLIAESGHSVTGMDTCYYEDPAAEQLGLAVATIRKDIRDIRQEDIAGHDAVIHLAGLSYDRLGELDRELSVEINHRASMKLAVLAKRAGVDRFLFASSCSVYGVSGEELLTEEMPIRPLSPYAETKASAEEGIAALADSDFSPVLLRFASAYGDSPNLRTDLVLNNLTGWACSTGKVRVRSNGTSWRPIAHVQDLSLAIATALQAPREAVHNQVFNVGVQGENYRVSDLANIVQDVVSGCVVAYSGESGVDPRNYRVDFTKIRRHLPGYQPTWNARRGAQELCQRFAHQPLDVEQFEGAPYVRVKCLSQLQEQGQLDAHLRWIGSLSDRKD